MTLLKKTAFPPVTLKCFTWLVAVLANVFPPRLNTLSLKRSRETFFRPIPIKGRWICRSPTRTVLVTSLPFALSLFATNMGVPAGVTCVIAPNILTNLWSPFTTRSWPSALSRLRGALPGAVASLSVALTCRNRVVPP